MYGINEKWSIWIVGLTKTDSDNDIITSLQTYETVAAVVRLPSPEQKNIVIVEFDSEILANSNIWAELPSSDPKH